MQIKNRLINTLMGIYNFYKIFTKSKIIYSMFGYKNIESSYKKFIALFSLFIDVVNSIFSISVIIIIGAFLYRDDKKEVLIAAGILLVGFIAFHAATGLMSTLVVIAERLNVIKANDEQSYDLLKMIITSSSPAEFSTLITSLGEARHKYFQGYAMLSVKDNMKEILIKKINIEFQEILFYEQAVSKDKSVGLGSIYKRNENIIINIKVPLNSVIFSEQAKMDFSKFTFIADGIISFAFDGDLLYRIQNFTLMKWRNTDIDEFYDSLKNLSTSQNYSDAKNLIDELSLIKPKS